jgi:hypothetical protein
MIMPSVNIEDIKNGYRSGIYLLKLMNIHPQKVRVKSKKKEKNESIFTHLY